MNPADQVVSLSGRKPRPKVVTSDFTKAKLGRYWLKLDEVIALIQAETKDHS